MKVPWRNFNASLEFKNKQRGGGKKGKQSQPCEYNTTSKSKVNFTACYITQTVKPLTPAEFSVNQSFSF